MSRSSLPRWLPNALTALRVALIPAFVMHATWCAESVAGGGSEWPHRAWAGAALLGIGASDVIDGWVARRFGQTSRFGEFLDPVADKLMVAIVLVMLVQAQSHWFEDIIAMIIIGREITISALREWMATIGERANVQVSFSGKVKTTLQMFGIAFMVYQNDLFGIPIYTVGFALLLAAAVMTIWSMFFYLKAAWPFIMADQDDGDSG